MAAFPCDADKAKALMPGNELHPFKLFGKGIVLGKLGGYQSGSFFR